VRLTLWAFIDPSTGEVSGTARRPSQDRIGALKERGCLVYEIEADLPDDLEVDARIRTEHVRKV